MNLGNILVPRHEGVGGGQSKLGLINVQVMYYVQS